MPVRLKVHVEFEAEDGAAVALAAAATEISHVVGEVLLAKLGGVAAAPAPAAPATEEAAPEAGTTGPVRLDPYAQGEQTEPGPWSAGGTWADHWPDAADVGQHNGWKRRALFALWRWPHAPQAGPINASPFGLDVTGRIPRPRATVFPLDAGLCEASRRLGFPRLFLSALGLEPGDEGLDLASTLAGLHPESAWSAAAVAEALELADLAGEGDAPAPTVADLLAAFHAAATRAVEAEWVEVEARIAKTRKEWDEKTRGPFHAPDRDSFLGTHSLGPVTPTHTTRPADPSKAGELADVEIRFTTCPPLVPLNLAGDTPEADAAVWTGTPRTGAPLAQGDQPAAT